MIHRNIFKTHYEIGRGKRPMHRNMLPQKKDKYTLLIFPKRAEAALTSYIIKWIRLNRGWGETTCKTSASTLIAGELKKYTKWNLYFLFQKGG